MRPDGVFENRRKLKRQRVRQKTIVPIQEFDRRLTGMKQCEPVDDELAQTVGKDLLEIEGWFRSGCGGGRRAVVHFLATRIGRHLFLIRRRVTGP